MTQTQQKREFTVLACSGWQGDRFKVVAIVDSKATAERIAEKIQGTEPRSASYIVRIGGKSTPHARLDNSYSVRVGGKVIVADASDWMHGDGNGNFLPESLQAKAAAIIQEEVR